MGILIPNTSDHDYLYRSNITTRKVVCRFYSISLPYSLRLWGCPLLIDLRTKTYNYISGTYALVRISKSLDPPSKFLPKIKF